MSAYPSILRHEIGGEIFAHGGGNNICWRLPRRSAVRTGALDQRRWMRDLIETEVPGTLVQFDPNVKPLET